MDGAITADDVAQDHSGPTINWLVSYARGLWKIGSHEPHGANGSKKKPLGEQATCFLCNASPMHPKSLSKHFQAKHVKARHFDAPFPCPKCHTQGLDAPTISSPSDWISHVKEAHGKINAPHNSKALMTPLTEEKPTHACFVCHAKLPASAPKHFNLHDFPADQLFPCPECPETERAVLCTGDDLLAHLTGSHAYPSIQRCPFCQVFCTTRGLSTHMRGHFKKKEAIEQIECPQCVGTEEKTPLAFSDFSMWLVHATTAHDHTSSDRDPGGKSRKRKWDEGSAGEEPLLPISIGEAGSEMVVEWDTQCLGPVPAVSYLQSPPPSEASDGELGFEAVSRK